MNVVAKSIVVAALSLGAAGAPVGAQPAPASGPLVVDGTHPLFWKPGTTYTYTSLDIRADGRVAIEAPVGTGMAQWVSVVVTGKLTIDGVIEARLGDQPPVIAGLAGVAIKQPTWASCQAVGGIGGGGGWGWEKGGNPARYVGGNGGVSALGNGGGGGGGAQGTYTNNHPDGAPGTATGAGEGGQGGGGPQGGPRGHLEQGHAARGGAGGTIGGGVGDSGQDGFQPVSTPSAEGGGQGGGGGGGGGRGRHGQMLFIDAQGQIAGSGIVDLRGTDGGVGGSGGRGGRHYGDRWGGGGGGGGAGAGGSGGVFILRHKAAVRVPPLDVKRDEGSAGRPGSGGQRHGGNPSESQASDGTQGQSATNACVGHYETIP